MGFTLYNDEPLLFWCFTKILRKNDHKSMKNHPWLDGNAGKKVINWVFFPWISHGESPITVQPKAPIPRSKSRLLKAPESALGKCLWAENVEHLWNQPYTYMYIRIYILYIYILYIYTYTYIYVYFWGHIGQNWCATHCSQMLHRPWAIKLESWFLVSGTQGMSSYWRVPNLVTSFFHHH